MSEQRPAGHGGLTLPVNEPDEKELELHAAMKAAEARLGEANADHSAALAALAAARTRLEEIAQSGKAAGFVEARDVAWEAEYAVDAAFGIVLQRRKELLAASWPYQGAAAQRLRSYASACENLAQKAVKEAEFAGSLRLRAELNWENSQEAERAAWSELLRFEEQTKTKRAQRATEILAH